MKLAYTSSILGLWVYTFDPFKDYRGQYTEIFNQNELAGEHKGLHFVQDDAIISECGVLRGYHGDNRTHKFITCLYGSFLMDVACIDPEREEFGEHETFFMNFKNPLALVVPPGYVNAHFCLSDQCIFFYKQDTYYLGEKYQYTVRWNEWDVAWPDTPTLSQRDGTCKNTRYSYIKRIEPDDEVLHNPEDINK